MSANGELLRSSCLRGTSLRPHFDAESGTVLPDLLPWIQDRLLQSFSTSTLWTFRAGQFLLGGCPLHCRKFSSIPGLCPLKASSDPSPVPGHVNQKCSHMLPHVLWRRGEKSSLVENHWATQSVLCSFNRHSIS